MLSAARVLLLVFGFLSLQLSLVSGGDRCPVVNVFAGSSTGSRAVPMSGMAMGGMATAGMATSQSSHDEESLPAQSSSHDDQPCDTHGQNSSCDSMTVCLFAALTAARDPQQQPRVQVAHRLTLTVRVPLTDGIAPDHPPPRQLS